MVKKSLVYAYMTLYLIFGAFTTIIFKEMDLITIQDQNFAHPYIQSTNLFLGESLCLLTYNIYKCIKRKKNRVSDYRSLRRSSSIEIPELYKKIGALSFGIPGVLYLFSIYLMFIGLVLSAASVYQIIRGIISLPVLIFSMIFLKRNFYRHHFFGVGCIIAGVAIVGIDSVIERSDTSYDPVMGTIVLILSQVIAGVVLVYEEYLMTKLFIEPIEAIGIEGIFGLCISIIILIALNFVPCSNSDFCYGGKVENTIQVLRDVFGNIWLTLLFFSSILAVSVLYWAGIYTTRYASALARSTLDSARIVLVWVFSIVIGWEEFQWLEIVGFVVLVFGTLVFNGILIIPLFGFREAAEAHKKEQSSLDSNF
jgi:drug/metabolite transporter (DMT)-like permease